MAISFELDETARMVRDATRELARRVIAPGAAERDERGQFPGDVIPALAEAGLLGVMVAPEYGGSGLNLSSYSVAVTEVAGACASTAVTMAVTNLCAGVIEAFGNEEQKRRFLPRIVGGEFKAGAFALSEPGSGSDAASLRTKAVRDGDCYVLDGQKQWVTSGDVAGAMIVFTRTSGEGPRGITAFIVEAGTAGVHFGKPEDKTGLRASHTSPVTFDGARIPVANRLGKEGEGFSMAMQELAVGRVGIASQSIGIGRAALQAAVTYAGERKAFGRALAEFQAIQFMLADSWTELEVAELLTRRAAFAYDRKLPHNREAAMAKLYASEAANRVCNRCLQIHGGYGYIRDFPVERYLRDARVTTIYEGTSEVQRLVIARDIVRQLRESA